MKLGCLAIAVCCAIVLAVGGLSSSKAAKPQPKEQVPAIASVLGVHVGVDTVEKLEKILGPGAVCTGGHPNGGREWKLKPGGWYVYADGFEYNSKGERILSSVEVSSGLIADPRQNSRVPVVSLPKSGLGCVGGIAPGQTIKTVHTRLKSLPKPENADGILVWKMRGNHKVDQDTSYRLWEMQLEYDRGKLAAISISAESTTYGLSH